jgi:sensor histidine kinase regulating citrate/malate metabolism
MRLSPLQKRIIDLSSKIVSTEDADEFERIASELKMALREHAENLRRVVHETKARLSKGNGCGT